MANLTTLRDVTSTYGANNPAAKSVTFSSAGTNTITFTGGTSSAISVGDTITITASTVTGNVGFVRTITAFDPTGGAGQGTAVVSGAVIPNALSNTATVGNTDSDPLAGIGGSTTGAFADALNVTWGDGENIVIADSSATVILGLQGLANNTNVQTLIVLEKVYDNSLSGGGVEDPNTVFTLLLNNPAAAGPAVLVDMKQGDVFYTSHLSAQYWPAPPGPLTSPTVLEAYQESGSDRYPIFKIVMASV